MSDTCKKVCASLPQRVVLRTVSKGKIPRKFIKEKQQLESVLGPSNPNWLEDATRRKQQQSAPAVRSYESVVDSPLLTPRISQICRDELQVGSTPDGSSYSPQTVNRILNSLPCGSTPDILLKPVLGNSPCLVSPIGLTLGKSQPCATLAHSLGANVEESALNWTNSLATPPRDVSLSAGKSPVDSVKTKDLARALFTPSKKLDTSCDSVNPLDSTCEDESCDLSADQGLANQSVDDVELSDLNIEGGNKQNVATLQNVSDVNLVMDVSKKAISGESYSNSPILDKDDMHLKDTSTDNINTTTMASSSPDKLQAISPLQNLVTSDLRPLNTSLNESTDSVKMLNKYQLPKAELKEHTPERVVDSDSKASNFCNDKASSPMMSPTNSENTAALITSPTFSQKSARKRNKIVSERSPTSSPRFSIDCALSDFFDPPSSAVGRRKRAPKKRKSTEMDTSSEFEVSDISIKCSTPKENMTLQSILSSKKKGKRSVKKVRFSDAVLTKKVTFSLENEEIEVDLKDSTHEYLVLKKEDKSNAEDVKQSRKELSKVKVEKTIKHEISADTMVTDENVKDKHREVGDLQNSDNKDRQMGLPVKSSNRENLTYCKRRGLKMRSKKECRDDAGKNMLFDSRLDKSGDRTIDKSDTNMNLSETTNNSKRNSDISEDSEAFSQVSPSALTEMCDIAQSASGDATITGGHHETALSSRNNNSNHSTKMKETLISKSHSLVKNKAKLPVPKKILNASPIEKSVQPVLNNKQPQVTVPRKFFYPSSKQIGTAHSKKVFEYKHENDRTENAGLVKSVCVKDIILKPDIDTEKQGDAGNIIDAEKEMDADKQKDGGKKKDAEKPNDAWKSVDAESDRMRNNHIKARGVKDDHADQINTNGSTKSLEFVKGNNKVMAAPLREVHQSANSTNLLDLTASGGFKTGSGKYIKVDSPTLLKAKQLLNEENDSTDKNVMLRSDSSFKGFQSAAGNCIKLDDSALRKAERLMSDDYKDVSNTNTSSIKVSSQSIQKAQKLISRVIISPKENMLSQNMIGNGLATDDELKVNDIDKMGENEQDYEFSQWFDEEMEKETKLIEEQAMNALISLQTVGENTSNDSKMDVSFKVQKDSLIKEGKNEIECDIETKTECVEAKEIVSEMEISKELKKKTNLIGFSTAAGKNIKLGETALQTAENLLFSAVSANNGGMDSKLKFELDRIDATGDCHKLVSTSLQDASTMSNNLGFQTASGKMLHISDKALKKASNLVENCFDEKDNILDCEAKDVRKLNLDIKDNVKPGVPDNGNTPKDGNSLSENFKKEINIPLSETLSLEEELAALTSLKSKTTGKSFLDEKMHNGFQGFQSASGKMFEMSDASLKKAASLISCDSADNVTDKQLNVQKHEVGVNPCSNNEFLESFKRDFSHHGSGIKSFEDRFDTLLAMKNSKSKTNNIASAHAKDSKKSSRLPPGSNVPKGFRPFKAPRITKPKKTIDATKTHEKVAGMKLDDRVCETNLVKHDRKMANGMSDRVNSIESTSDVKDISLTISKKASSLGDMLNSDKKLEHFEKELVPKKLEGMQEKHGPDIQDCYNGLLSQMFADEMEPDEVSGINSATSNDLDSNTTNTNSLNKCVESKDYEKSESLKNNHDNTISKFEDEMEIKNTGSKTLGDSTKFNVETLNVENNSNIECKYGGFSTASGKKLDVKAESLTEAKSILNDSDALSLHRQENTGLENDIDSTGDCIVPDVEVNHQSENKVQNHENRSNTRPKSDMPTSKSPCMFKSASGKQLDVTDKVLTEAKCKFNDFESNLDGFDLKSRENMNIKERPQEVPDIERSKYLKNSSNRSKLHFDKEIKRKSEKSNSPLVQNGLLQQMHLEESPGSSIFQKANGKCINVPEAALKVARDNFEDLDKENIPRTIAGSLFQTASGNSITIYETSPKHARDSLQDSKLDSGLVESEHFTLFQASSSSETKSMGGSLFQTARGKDMIVSEEALTNVRSRFKDSDLEVLPVSEENNLSQTASDKNVTVSNKTLKMTRKSSEQVNEQSEVSESKGGSLFQTASGKHVAVTEKALKSARNKLESTESYNDNILTNFLFQTASGKSVAISENALKVARKNLDDNDVKNTQFESEYNNSLFKTAGGENLNLSEPALNIATGSMDISETDKGKPKVCYRPMFTTASGKNVSISKEALRRATDHLKECEGDIKMTKSPGVSSFQTTRKNVNIAVESLHSGRDILTDSETALEMERKSSGCMFQTASGENIKISDEVLKAAQETLNESENKSEAPQISVNSLFQTASGKSFSVSEKALNEIKENWIDSTENFNMQMPQYSSNSLFQAASGKNVAVSARALKEIKANWTVSAEDFSIPTPKYSSNSLFQTASGKTVAVSEKALKVARDNFKETETNNLSSVKESSNMKPSESPKETNHCSVGSLFQTAGGKNVTVSEKALKAARDSFRESETSNRTVEKEVWSSETLSRNQTSKGSLNQNASSLFQTASVKDVIVSENALKVARNNFKDSEMDILTNGKEVALKSSKRDFQPRNLSSNIGSLFQTASGKHVNVSEKALTLARESLKDTESKTLLERQHKSTEESSYSDQNVKSSIKFPGSLFHTASGKHVNVSEKALKFARDSLKDTESNPLLGGQQNNVEKDSSSNQNVGPSNKFPDSLFQTASGKNVNVSERALKFARDSLKDTESEKKYNSFEGNSSSEQNVRPSSKFSGSLFQTASGKNVNVSEKALKFARDSLKNSESEGKNSSSDQNVIPTSKVPNSLFQTASGKNVDVLENALSEARNALDSENKNCQESVPSTVRTEELQIDSGTKDMESLSTSLEALSSLKQKMFESRGGTSTAKRGKSEFDEGDQDRTPLKRRRVDMKESVRMSPIERAPLRSGPEGLLTDRRLATSRGFKPVWSQTLFKPPARIALKDLTKDVNSASKKSTPTKSSFQTPYKTTPTKTPESPTPSTAKVVVHAPVFIPKTIGNAHDKETVTPMKTAIVRDGKDAKYTEGAVSLLSKRMSSETNSRLDGKGKENLDNKERIQNTGGARNKYDTNEKTSGSEAFFTGDNKHIDIENINGSKDIANDDKVIADTSVVIIEEKEPSTDENSFDDRMDDCTQNDDAEIFYCNLVEARKHQEELIKQKQKLKIQPVQGRLYRQKQSSRRWKLRDFVRALRQGCRQNVSKPVPVTSSTAKDYKFGLKDFYGEGVTHVLVGDGAHLVPDDAGAVGRQEFYSAFLTMDGVDPKLISDVWVDNHYRWIVWKLAAYEVVCPSSSAGRYLTPEMVMLQLKYRYDREIDLCERSALKKIFERDDAAGKRMVLCVAGIVRVAQTCSKDGNQDNVSHDMDSKILLEVTDSWYSIKAQIDVPLTDLVRQGQITVGQKLCVSGAELIGAEDACSPLEAPDSIMLKICCNSCRPAPWDSTLGYQTDPRPLCVPLTGLRGEGGTVGVMDLILVRKYPIMYMEKLPGGGCVFRGGRAEEKVQQIFQSKQQENMEKLYRKIEQEMEREEKEEKQSISKKKWSRSEVEYLQSGRDIYEALTASRLPDMIEGLLTDRQIGKLMDYKRQLYDEKQRELNSRFQAAWQDNGDGGVSMRNVTPVLKFRVAGCAHRDMDNKITTILTVWRPASEICDLEEGKRYKVYSLNTSTARSKYVGHDVQLTATKQTKFQLMNVDENFLDSIYEPREVLWASDISRRQPPYGEVDFVGVIVLVSHTALEESFSRQPDTVYCADCQGNLLAIKFWQRLKCYDDGLLTVGNVLCCTNLMDKAPYRCRQLPAVEASTEFTQLTNKPQNNEQRQAVMRLNSALKEKPAFLERASSLLADIQEKRQSYRTTPEKRKYSTASFSDCELTPRKTTPPVNHQKNVAMETKSDLDLSMSIDSSFVEEICKADLDQVIADQGNDAPPVKDQKTESNTVTGPDLEDNPLHVTVKKNVMEISGESPSVLTLEKDVVLVENTDLNLDKSAKDTNIGHGHTGALTNEDLSHKDSFTNSHLSSTSALTGDGHGGCEPLPDHDQCKSKVSVDTDQNCHQDTKESENQSSSADNKVTASLHSVPSVNKESASSNTNMSQIAASDSALVRSPEDRCNIKVLDINSQTPNVQRSGERIGKEPVKSDTSKFPTPLSQSHLVRSPEEELISRLTPQTLSSQHNISGLTPQTPSSQEGRGVYQAKMARLLSYGSPSPLTPVRTPVSRTVTKGFKPPSFVKK